MGKIMINADEPWLTIKIWSNLSSDKPIGDKVFIHESIGFQGWDWWGLKSLGPLSQTDEKRHGGISQDTRLNTREYFFLVLVVT